MQIIRCKEAIERKKSSPTGEDFRRYYLPSNDPLEIIETVIPPGVSQPPHAHEIVREATLVLEGKVILAEIVGGVRTESELEAGDFAVFDPRSCHTMENHSEVQAHTLTFKFLGEEKNAELFVTDKLENCTDPVKLKTTEVHDPRYAPYVEVYNNLDKLLWQLPAFLVAVSVFGFGLFGHLITNPQTVIPPFTHNDTVGAIFLLLGMLYLLGVYSMWRIRKHHTLMGKELAELEPAGYFHKRKHIVEKWWPPSAPHMFMLIFLIVALLLFALGISNIWHP